jgi:hypothetical protein
MRLRLIAGRSPGDGKLALMVPFVSHYSIIKEGMKYVAFILS